MAEASQSSSQVTEGSPTAHSQSTDAKAGKHVHHGRTPAAWAGVAIAMVGFILGGIALVDNQNWVLFIIGAVLCVIALVVARIMQVLGYGAG